MSRRIFSFDSCALGTESATDTPTGYRLQCFRHGFLGRVEPHPLRVVQALIRYRAATLAASGEGRS
jgi:hypothetical protein